MNRKLGINTDCLNGVDELATLELAQNEGFRAITTALCDIDSVSALKNKADSLGVDFDYLHSPFKGINGMWIDGDDYLSVYNGIVKSINTASECGVKAVVVHVSSGWTAPKVNDLGLSRFDSLVDLAIQKSVTIAFENLRMVGNLACLIDRYECVDNVRYCFDSGHEHCYTKTVSWLDIFTNKLIATHIHDNTGRELYDKSKDNDTHWLPFDGSYNYYEMMRKLDKYEYSGPLVLEVFRAQRNDYMRLSNEEFIHTCYDRIQRISNL